MASKSVWWWSGWTVIKCDIWKANQWKEAQQASMQNTQDQYSVIRSRAKLHSLLVFMSVRTRFSIWRIMRVARIKQKNQANWSLTMSTIHVQLASCVPISK